MTAVLNFFGWGSGQPVTTVRISGGSGSSSSEWEMVGGAKQSSPRRVPDSPRSFSSSGSTFVPGTGEAVVHDLGGGRALEVRVIESPTSTATSPVYGFRGETRSFSSHGRTLLKVTAAATFVFAIALLAFFIAYSQGVFHFESFIGPVGHNVSLTLTAALAVLSGTVLLCSYR